MSSWARISPTMSRKRASKNPGHLSSASPRRSQVISAGWRWRGVLGIGISPDLTGSHSQRSVMGVSSPELKIGAARDRLYLVGDVCPDQRQKISENDVRSDHMVAPVVAGLVIGSVPKLSRDHFDPRVR